MYEKNIYFNVVNTVKYLLLTNNASLVLNARVVTAAIKPLMIRSSDHFAPYNLDRFNIKMQYRNTKTVFVLRKHSVLF